MSLQYDSEVAEELAGVIATALGVPRDQIDAYVRARREQHQRRLAHHAAKWSSWMAAMTDVQMALVSKAEQEGHRLVKMYRDARSRRVAAMMVKEKVWNGAKGRIGRKLLMVYPDGSRTETMERTISIRQSF